MLCADSLLQLPGGGEQFVGPFRFPFWFDRHHIASRPSLEALRHLLHRRLAFGGDGSEQTACGQPQNAVCLFGQVISERIIAQKSADLRVVDEEDFDFTEIEEVVAVLAMPIADVPLLLGEPSDFVLRQEQAQLVPSGTAGDRAPFAVDADYPCVFPTGDVIS